MRFIHLADLHLGKKLKTIRGDIELDFCSALDQVKQSIREFKPEFLFISGDIFHSKNPSQEIEDMFIDFIVYAYENVNFTFVISGNHDSSKKLKIFDKLNKHINKFSSNKVFIYTDLDLIDDIKRENLRPISLNGVDILLLPFIEYRLALNVSYNFSIEKEFAYSFICSHFISSMLSNSRNSIKILLAHTYIENSVLGGTESRNYIDTNYYVKMNDIDNRIVYGALGHIHRYQKLGSRNLFYSGSLIPLDFSETFDHGIIMGEIVNNFPKVEFVKLKYKEFLVIKQSSFIDIIKEVEKNKDKYIKVMYHNLETNDLEKLLKMDCVIKLQKLESGNQENVAELLSQDYLEDKDPFSVVKMYNKFYEVERGMTAPEEVLVKLRRYVEEIESQ